MDGGLPCTPAWSLVLGGAGGALLSWMEMSLEASDVLRPLFGGGQEDSGWRYWPL